MIRIDLRDAKSPQKFWATGDWHIGHEDHAEDLFRAHLERAVREGWHLLHVGDSMEMVIPASKLTTSGAMSEQKMSPEEQRKELISILKRLKGKGVMLPGNHERRIDKATGMNFVSMILQSFNNIVPMEDPGMVQILVGSQRYNVVMHHGEGPVVSPITLLDRLQRDYEDADLIIAGHIHAGTFDPAYKVTSKDGRTVLRLRVGHYLMNPRYAIERPIARIGAPGSWLLVMHHDRKLIEPQWMGK